MTSIDDLGHGNVAQSIKGVTPVLAHLIPCPRVPPRGVGGIWLPLALFKPRGSTSGCILPLALEWEREKGERVVALG